MQEQIISISVDLPLILRVLIAFGWGGGWAAYLQFTRNGKFLAEERTWLTVVIGVGVDMAISYPKDWYTIMIVISASAVGIIIRSIWNEQRQYEVNAKGYKVLWGLEDAIVMSQKAIEQLSKVLDAGQLVAEDVSRISKTISTLHRLRQIIQDARRGEYNQKTGLLAKS